MTASGVLPGPYEANAASGTMVSAAVATAAPVELLLFPVLESDACAAVRTALFAAVLDDDDVEDDADAAPAPRMVTFSVSTEAFLVTAVALLVSAALALLAEAAVEDRLAVAAGVICAGPVRLVGALTAPPPSCVVDEPVGEAPDVLIQICFKMDGRCQYCGATSMTT